jgi:hypothetical protein
MQIAVTCDSVTFCAKSIWDLEELYWYVERRPLATNRGIITGGHFEKIQ